jgi:integrase-like protein
MRFWPSAALRSRSSRSRNREVGPDNSEGLQVFPNCFSLPHICNAIYGHVLQQQIRAMGIAEVLGAPRSPWQRAYVERIIGSIRRDCLDQMIIFDQSSLRRILRSYLDYYHRSRTHLSLDKDAPIPRAAQPAGRIVAIPQVWWTSSPIRTTSRLSGGPIPLKISSHPSTSQPLSVLSKTPGLPERRSPTQDGK